MQIRRMVLPRPGRRKAVFPHGVSAHFHALVSARFVAKIFTLGIVLLPNWAVVFPQTSGADLTISKSHSGNFVVGTNGTYTITVSNIGSAASNGTITVTDTVPPGLSYVSATGTNWTCSASGQAVTCTSSAAVAAGANANAITLTVLVTPNIGQNQQLGTRSPSPEGGYELSQQQRH